MLVGILPFVAANIDKKKNTSKKYIKFFIDQVEPEEMAHLTEEYYRGMDHHT